MSFSERFIDLKHFFKNNTEAFNQEGAFNTLKVGSVMFEDEMFIGSAFGSDLRNAKKHNQENIDAFYKRIGIATINGIDNSEKFM